MDTHDSAHTAHTLLVIRSQRGDRGAMEELFLQHNQALGYYLRRMLRDGEAADLQQEVWLTVLRRLHQLREPAAFVVWLYQIARRKTLSRLQARGMAPLVELEAASAQIDDYEPEFSADDAEAIHKGLASLSPTHREAIVLRFVEGLTYEQIAEVTSTNTGTVRSRLHYAKLELRKHLEGSHERA